MFQVFIENDLQVTNYIKDVAATRSNLSEVIMLLKTDKKYTLQRYQNGDSPSFKQGSSKSSTRIVVGCDVDIFTAEVLTFIIKPPD